MKRGIYAFGLLAVCLLLVVGTIAVTKWCGVTQSTDETKEALTYETDVFDKDAIMEVSLTIDKDDWQAMLDAPEDKTYYSCDVTINGETYHQVGIRIKGNSSLRRVAKEGNSTRYGFKLEFGHYIEGQTCHGLDKMLLNANYGDATCMKEYLAYDMHTRMGIATPLFSYADVQINGNTQGLYLAVEAIDESFLLRNYGSTEGQLYKPDYNKFGSLYTGADLSYQGEDYDKYETIFESAKLGETTEAQKQAVITALQRLEEKEELETYIDVDQMLRMIVVGVCIMNDDSYFGTQIHNYYLYERDGQLIMLPWDYNLAFGGLVADTENVNSKDLINRPIDSVIPMGSWEKRPMIKRLLQVDDYLEQYHEYLDEFISSYFESGTFTEEIDRIQALIDDYVKADPTAFYSYEQYTQAVDMLKKVGNARAESIRKQLNGEIGSTYSEQIANPEAYVDTEDIDFLLMGNLHDFGEESEDSDE
jgi:hypothetical protein